MLLPVNDLPLEAELPITEPTKQKRPKQPEKDINTSVMDSWDEEEEYTYHYDLRSRIPYYRLVGPQPEEPAIPELNPHEQPELHATASEFDTDRQDPEIIQDRVEVPECPEMVEERPNQVEVTEDANIEDEAEVRRSQRQGRPTERLTYDTLGQPSYTHWSANVNSLIPSHPFAFTPNFVHFPYTLQPQLCCPNCFTLVR